MKGLKNLDFKALLVDHGEKFGVALIVLFAAFAVFTSQWSGYEGEPTEFISKAETAKEQILASTWPEEKRQEFALVDFLDASRQLVTPINLAKYDYSTPMRWPLYRKQERIREPEWLAVEDLVATPGRAIVAVVSEEARQLAEANAAGAIEGEDPNAELDDMFDDEFAPRTGAGAASMGPGAGGGLIGSGDAMYDGAMAGGEYYDPASADTIYMDEGYMEEGYMGGGMGTNPGVEARGVRFIAVRGIYPLRKQVEKLARAMNLQVSSDASDLLTITNFKLQRKAAVAGNDPWAGEWEDVDINVALEVLTETQDFDIDPVDAALTDRVFTMPLPKRLLGYWGRWANHPKLKNFELSPEEQARENELNARLLAKWRELEAERPQPVQPGGFAAVQANMREIRYEVMQEAGQEILSDYMQEYETDSRGRAQKPDLNQLKNRLTAVGRVLLFRYFDFDVEPGRAYKYRVQVELQNPSFNLPLDQVIDQSVAEGETRTTPWSEESELAVMSPDVEYFVDDIERDPLTESLLISWGDDPGRTRRPIVDLEMFQWDPSLGTMVADKLNMRLLGSFVGGTKETLVLDVAKPSLERSTRQFHADDLLLDVAKLPPIDDSLHKDLQLSKDALASLSDGQMIVVDEYGELETVEPKSETSEQARMQRRLELQRKPFEDLLNRPDPSELDMLGMEYAEGMEGDYMNEMYPAEGRRGGRRQRNSTRLRGPMPNYP